MSNRRLSIAGVDLAFYAVTQQARGSAMGKTIMLCACLLLSSLLTGCSLFIDIFSDEEEPEPSLGGFSIQSEQNVFVVEEDQPLVLTFAYVNEGTGPFYLGSCSGTWSHALEKLVDGEWTLAYSPYCAIPGGTIPIKITPGERYNVTQALVPADWDPNPQNGTWHGGDDIVGTYRLRERIYTEWDQEKGDEGTLPSALLVSNPFEIRRQP